MDPGFGVLCIAAARRNSEKIEGDGLMLGEAHAHVPIVLAVGEILRRQQQGLQALQGAGIESDGWFPFGIAADELPAQFGEPDPFQAVVDRAKYLERFGGEEIGGVEIEIPGLPPFEAATADVGAVHQQLAEHHLQAADRTDIANGGAAMHRQLVAVHLRVEQDGCLLLFADLEGR